jgi:hypothetical protein
MAAGRQIALLSALAAALVALAGCGGGDTSSAGIDPASGEAINAKLDQIQARASEGDCTGENSAKSALESLQGDVSGGLLANEDEGFVSDLSEMLDQLGQQIDEQCEQKDQTTSSSTKSTTTTTTTTTEPTTTEDTTSTKDHETSSTTTEDTTPTPPDNPGGGPPPTTPGGGGTPPGQGGTQPGGSGGFSPGKEKPEPKKPEKPHKHHGKPKDEKR